MKGYYESPLGLISFICDEEGLYGMMFSDEKDLDNQQSPMVLKIQKSLDLYFKKKSYVFDCPLHFNSGTPFQKEVWKALLSIPYGSTKSYQEIAEMIGRPKAFRAVGQACKKNPIGIIVPCHRVIGKDGSLTGYSGKNYIDLKKKLLEHERMSTNESRKTQEI